ncbi:MAG TPA: hypothetical protein PKC24_12230 [Cyclobacteriaceae bacterium]|nr:hypothetical protein [Cyclobacteriaceae bacterium]
MARVNANLIMALRNTAKKLKASDQYQWGHMGACNCGFLAQEVCQISKQEIHRSAMLGYGDWNEQLNDYCPTSGLPMDGLISKLIEFGFDADDLKRLEKLSDQGVLQRIPIASRHLKHNIKADVIRYMLTWADLLEEELLEKIEINFQEIEVVTS